MPILSGTKLGRYEIRAKIGAGGMGEVYLAHDAELERDVALKVLAADVASDQQRMQRFIQEAKTASALNHPNISSGSIKSSPITRKLLRLSALCPNLIQFTPIRVTLSCLVASVLRNKSSTRYRPSYRKAG